MREKEEEAANEGGISLDEKKRRGEGRRGEEKEEAFLEREGMGREADLVREKLGIKKDFFKIPSHPNADDTAYLALS